MTTEPQVEQLDVQPLSREEYVEALLSILAAEAGAE